jgi:hypothetical protein
MNDTKPGNTMNQKETTRKKQNSKLHTQYGFEISIVILAHYLSTWASSGTQAAARSAAVSLIHIVIAVIIQTIE